MKQETLLRKSTQGDIDPKKSDIGVIVARFQCPFLHEGHTGLIDHVLSRHDVVLIFLGKSRNAPDEENPMDFITRKLMIQKQYPQVNIIPINDRKYSTLWSATLDSEIDKFKDSHGVTLYGSRDSFFDRYTGKYKNNYSEFEAEILISATQIRKKVAKEFNDTEDFRKGVISARSAQYPTGYMAADIIIYDKKTKRVLLGQKPDEPNWRFIGGLFDPEKDTCTKDTAKREVLEETTKVEIEGHATYDNFDFQFEQLIDDWRYRKSKSKILSFVYLAEYMGGTLIPNDDINKLKWFHIDELGKDVFEPEHIVIYERAEAEIRKALE